VVETIVGATVRRLGGDGIGREATAALRTLARTVGRLDIGRLCDTRGPAPWPPAGWLGLEAGERRPDDGGLEGRLGREAGFLGAGGRLEPPGLLLSIPPLPDLSLDLLI